MSPSQHSENGIVLYRFVRRVYRLVIVSLLGLMGIIISAYWVGFRVDHDLKKQENIQILRSETTALSSVVLKMHQRQLQFLTQKQVESVRDHHELSNRALAIVGRMRRNPSAPLIEKSHQSLNDLLQKQMQQFDLIVMRQQKIGLSEKFGLRLQLRAKARELEEAFKEIGNDSLLLSLLMIRRHEKDFLMRRQRVSLLGINQQIHILAQKLREVAQIKDDLYNTEEMLQTYRGLFSKIAKETLQFEKDISVLQQGSKELSKVLENMAKSLQEHSQEVSGKLSYDFSWFKSALGGFAILLMLIIGMQGLLIIRQLTTSGNEKKGKP